MRAARVLQKGGIYLNQKKQKQTAGQKSNLQKKCAAGLSLLRKKATPAALLRVGAALVLLVMFVVVLIALNRPTSGSTATAASKLSFVPARVTAVISDNALANDWSEGRRMGAQELEVELLSGAFKGTLLQGINYLSAYSNIDAREGTRVIVRLAFDENDEPYILAFTNYDRGLVLGIFVLVFAALLVIIGGKKGLMALLGLAFTLVCLWFLLIPLILRGVPPIPATVGFVSLTTVISLLFLTGFSKKTFCATLGCVGGVAAAGIFAAAVGAITPLGGFNMPEAEELVLRATEQSLSISGLLVSGILIASLGAVMDVAMSISSACSELHSLNPNLPSSAIFRSGMNIGRDAMGTMANTLILAFAGAALNMLILFRAYDYPLLQIINSDMMAIEILQGIAGSIGIVLTVPLVTFISAKILTRKH